MERKKVKIKKTIPVSYSGSLIQQNFGESVSNHGYLWWDLETKTFEAYDIKTNYGFYNFKIKSLEDLETNSEKLTNL